MYKTPNCIQQTHRARRLFGHRCVAPSPPPVRVFEQYSTALTSPQTSIYPRALMRWRTSIHPHTLKSSNHPNSTHNNRQATPPVSSTINDRKHPSDSISKCPREPPPRRRRRRRHRTLECKVSPLKSPSSINDPFSFVNLPQRPPRTQRATIHPPPQLTVVGGWWHFECVCAVRGNQLCA